jgi:hypothetical protein
MLSVSAQIVPFFKRHPALLALLTLLPLLLVARLTHQPGGLLLPGGLLVQPLLVSIRERRWVWLLDTFWPLGAVYLALGGRLLIALVGHLSGAAEPVPEPWASWLNLGALASLSSLGVLLLQARYTLAAYSLNRLSPGLLLAGVAGIWAALTYFGLASHGVTGADPYGYVQMAVDLARQGHPLREFPLTAQAAAWGLPLYPTVAVGYTVPSPERLMVGTPWAPGHSLLLALGYLLLGEHGLYWTTPLIGLLALGAIWLLATELLFAWPAERRTWAAGLSVLILATAYQQFERLTVAMADVTAQVFTMLAVYTAWRSYRAPGFKASGWAGLAGLSLGLAFAARYTQVLLAVALLPLLLTGGRTGWTKLLVAALGAWLPAVPVLAYHHVAFGSPWLTGSQELAFFAWGHVGTTLGKVAAGLAAPGEFGWLLPFAAWGAFCLWRNWLRPTLALGLWLAVMVLFHLPYELFIVRDILSVWPVLAIWSAVGLSEAGARVVGRLRRPWLPGALAALLILLFWIRTQPALLLFTRPETFGTYGYVTAPQRAAFETLAQLTPPGAIIAAELNAGAINLYAQRPIIRPADWSAADWLRFVERALEQGDELYLLEDGVKMRLPLAVARQHYTLEPVTTLPLTYFFEDGSGESRPVALYRLGPAVN